MGRFEMHGERAAHYSRNPVRVAGAAVRKPKLLARLSFCVPRKQKCFARDAAEASRHVGNEAQRGRGPVRKEMFFASGAFGEVRFAWGCIRKAICLARAP
jgi:hypothetical protein